MEHDIIGFAKRCFSGFARKTPGVGHVLIDGDDRPVDPSTMKISVLLPNYNHSRFINENIDAVRSQSYPNWELVIVDDGSTDDSVEKIRSYAKIDHRIVPIFLPHNRGALAAIEAGLAAVTGSLVYGSAADDHISNDRFFELVVAALAQHPEAAGVFGKAQVVDAASGKQLWEMGSSPSPGFLAPHMALRSFFTGGLFVPGACAIWKRAQFDSLGGFDPSLGPQTDFYINHALPAVYGAVFIDEIFTSVRSGAESFHRSATDEEFFQRHALTERKFRMLDLPTPIDPQWLHIWRARLIDSRLAVSRQQTFFDSVQTASKIEPWEQSSLPPQFIECVDRVSAEADRLKHNLADRVASAHRILNDVAGLIPGEGENETHTPH